MKIFRIIKRAQDGTERIQHLVEMSLDGVEWVEVAGQMSNPRAAITLATAKALMQNHIDSREVQASRRGFVVVESEEMEPSQPVHPAVAAKTKHTTGAKKVDVKNLMKDFKRGK